MNLSIGNQKPFESKKIFKYLPTILLLCYVEWSGEGSEVELSTSAFLSTV